MPISSVEKTFPATDCRGREKFEMHENRHELKVLLLDGSTGFYRMERFRAGDFFGPVDMWIHLAFKHNALTISAGLLAEIGDGGL